jgi:signal transduction histidine kinase
MGRRAQRVPLLGLCCLLWAGVATGAPAGLSRDQREVLVLYATSRDSRIAVVGERDLTNIIGNGLNGALDYYSEFIDQGRFAEPAYQDAFRDFLLVKYERKQFDLIITMNSVATEFAVRNRDELSPGTPVVFFADSRSGARIPNSTVIVGALDFRSTVDLATELQPDLRHLFVVAGSSAADAAYADQARRQLSHLPARIDVRFLSGLRTSDLLARLSALPDHSAVYYILVNQDGTGESFQPLQYLDRVIAAANAPTYCWVDSAMDRGILGGALKNQGRETELIARLALRVLGGERADDIPVAPADLTVRQVDWRQLRRWGIPEERVPPGTIVRFKVPTLWDRYAAYILGAAVLLVAQTLLIGALLVQRVHRRRAERQLRSREAELRTSYGRIRDMGGRLLDAQESERSRIARELHDDISQQLALLEMDLEMLAGTGSGPGNPPSELLERTRQLARSVHDLSHRLHPARLRLIGLVPALDGLCQELSRAEVPITLTHENVPRALPPGLMLCVFRVAQEALQNALKYSGARTVSMNVRADDDGLRLTVADDGRGFDVNAAWGAGLGLLSMAERLDAFEGHLDVQSAPGTGTRIHATVPAAALGFTRGVAT